MLPAVMAFPEAGPKSDSERDPKGEDRSADRASEGSVSDDKERWRLAWHYADMTDGELESLAAESASLTEVARRALQSDMNRRGLHVELAETTVPAASPVRSRKLATVCRFRD